MALMTLNYAIEDPSSKLAGWQRKQLLSPISAKVPCRDELIKRFLPIVDRIVAKIARTLPNHLEIQDLRSIGVVGLMQAIEKYDPEQEATFRAYLSLRIRGSILDELRRLDCLPRTSRAKARRLKTAEHELEQQLGRKPTEEELCKRLNLNTKEFRRMLRHTEGVAFVSLDASPLNNDGEDSDLHDTIADDKQQLSHEHIQQTELKQLLVMHIAELPLRQRKIIAMYYHEGLRLADIAQAYGVTEARICQIHAQAISNLRSALTASYQS